MNDKGYYHSLKKRPRDPHARPPSFSFHNARHRVTRGHSAQPRALGARRPPHHPSRARLRKSPSRRPARSPSGATCSKPLLTISGQQACKRRPTTPAVPHGDRQNQPAHPQRPPRQRHRPHDEAPPQGRFPAPTLSPDSFLAAVITDLFSQGVSFADHADPRTTRLYNRRHKKVTHNIVERISI